MTDDNRIKLTVSLEGPAALIERAAEILHSLMSDRLPKPTVRFEDVPPAINIAPRRRFNGGKQ